MTRSAAVAFVLWAAVGQAAAAQAASDYRIFTTCPVYRDTDSGRKSGCWLAQSPDDGLQYDITAGPAKPDYAHAVLVEGRVSAKQDNACGGIVIDPASVSVLDTPCPRYIIPAEGYTGRKFVLPVTNIPPLGIDRPLDPGPFSRRTFRLFFEFDSSFITYQFTDYYLDNMVHWLRSAQPRRIVITGYGAIKPASVSGKDLAERRDIAKERAELVARSLQMLGFDRKMITTRVGGDSPPIEDETIAHLPQHSRRRVEVTAEF